MVYFKGVKFLECVFECIGVVGDVVCVVVWVWGYIWLVIDKVVEGLGSIIYSCLNCILI